MELYEGDIVRYKNREEIESMQSVFIDGEDGEFIDVFDYYIPTIDIKFEVINNDAGNGCLCSPTEYTDVKYSNGDTFTYDKEELYFLDEKLIVLCERSEDFEAQDIGVLL